MADYRRIIRWLGGEATTATAVASSSSRSSGGAFSVAPTWANATPAWLLSVTPGLPPSVAGAFEPACPGGGGIARACSNSTQYALDGDPDTVMLVRAVNASALRGPRGAGSGGGSSGSGASAVALLLDLGACTAVSGLQASVRLAPSSSTGGRGNSSSPLLAGALRPVLVSFYALSDPSAAGWREVPQGPLRVAYRSEGSSSSGGGTATSAASFPSYSARYFAVVVTPAAVAAGDDAAAPPGAVVLRVPDLSLRVASVADASAPCQSDELAPFDDAEPTVPTVGRMVCQCPVCPRRLSPTRHSLPCCATGPLARAAGTGRQRRDHQARHERHPLHSRQQHHAGTGHGVAAGGDGDRQVRVFDSAASVGHC